MNSTIKPQSQINSSKQPLKEIKIILLGESNVGKTSLIQQYIDGKINKQQRATIACDFFCKNVYIEEYQAKVQVQIWDTAGQERFRSIATSFYRQADICVLTYDINNPQTFESLVGWKKIFIENACPEKFGQFPYILIGNKLDQVQGNKRVQRTVIDSFIESKKMAGGYECSALNKSEVDNIFFQVILEAYKYKYDNPYRVTQNIKQNQEQEENENQSSQQQLDQQDQNIKLSSQDKQNQNDNKSSCLC